MFLIAFDKTFRYFFDYFEPFSQIEAVVLGSRNILQLLSFSKSYTLTAQQLQNNGAKIQIISAETLSYFGFGLNTFETRISAKVSFLKLSKKSLISDSGELAKSRI